MREYWKLLQFLRGHTKIFALAVFFMLISAVFEGVQLSMLVPMIDRIFTDRKIILPNQLPEFVAKAVDWFNAMDPYQLFGWFPFVFLGLFLIKNVVMFIYDLLMNDTSQRIMRDVRSRLYETIQNLSLDYFSQRRTGELISRITNDVQVIENAVSYAVTDLFRQSFIIIVFVAIVFSIHYQAALIIFVLFLFIAVPMRLIGRRLRKLSKSSQEKMADINSLLLETISGVQVVKAFCMEPYETNRFRQQNQAFYKLKMKSIKRLLVISPITELIGASCGVFLVFGLGAQVLKGELSFGIFGLFLGSILSTISPVKKLANVHAIIQQALAANKRIYDVLETKPTVQEKPHARALPRIKSCIKLEGVSFQYDEESGDVLKDIDLEIRVGDLLAIVGPTGTGKSTLVNLISRFYDPTEGRVTMDGVDLKEVSLKSLRQQIGIVSQETILFNDTVKANLSYGQPFDPGRLAKGEAARAQGVPQSSQKEIEEAAQRAYAHPFIVRMPQGYDTVIGDRGFRLSGGEKQRLAIARAILKNPPILILDEATSQLDSESEKFVQQALDELMEGRTVICIAHRLSTIVKATKIVVLDQGRVVGVGVHEDLLKDCDLYRRLYQTQFEEAV